jgi:nucleotide-binding universal stress UspA family protein
MCPKDARRAWHVACGSARTGRRIDGHPAPHPEVAMVDIRRILVPVDFSDPSREALRQAAALAQWYHAHVTVIHAVSPLFVSGPLAMVPAATSAVGISDYAIAHLENQLRDWAAAAEIPPTSCDIAVELGDPASLIIAASERFTSGLIVLGTHGRSGFERFVLGSVAEKVVHRAACPVLTVPPRSTGRAVIPFRRVLCAVDFSPESDAAVHYALSLAWEADASITLLHVVDWPEEADAVAERDPAVAFMRDRREEAGRKQLETLVTAERVALWVTSRIDHGKAHERIVAVALEKQADLIVMGAHSRNLFERGFIGSTTNQVLRRAACPVLTIRVASTAREVAQGELSHALVAAG